MTTHAALRMPDLVGGTREFQHTLNTALRVLADLGATGAIELRCADDGFGERPLAVVRQTPLPRELLTPSTTIVLTVCAPRGLHSIPFALRTGGRPRVVPATPETPAEMIFGIDRLMDIFDDQVQAAACAARQSGDYLELRPDRDRVTRRWVERIFAITTCADWPPAMLYRLARLLPSLHALAGTERGVRIAMREIFALELKRLSLNAVATPIDEGDATRLRANASYLGVSTTLGTCVSYPAVAELTFEVADARAVVAAGEMVNRQRRLLVYALLLPVHCAHPPIERWLVGDRTKGIRLADETHRGLGIGSYLSNTLASSGAVA